MPVISVIVPVYKVEPYLHRCVDSILSQTYTDFELILVDDGSPDNCGAICDKYAKLDSRIHVLHKKNGGLSSARNAGIDWVFANSDSQWFSFIDSDDWVHPRYLELLYRAATEYGVRISQCLHIETDGSAPVPGVEAKMRKITAEEQYIHWYKAFAWGKLYARACFESIRYPIGKLYEDVAIWYKLLFAEKEIGLVEEVLYYYYVNMDSIVRSAWKPARLAQIWAWEEQLDYLSRHFQGPILDQALRYCCRNIRHQRESIQSSNAISEHQRKHYLNYTSRRLSRVMRKYRNDLKRLGIYSDYYPHAHPKLLRFYHFLTGSKKH